MRLLLVEDEHRLAVRLARGLREADGSGLDLLAEWRADGFAAPILGLTARDRLVDKVSKFGARPDDRLIHTIAGVGYVLRTGGDIP